CGRGVVPARVVELVARVRDSDDQAVLDGFAGGCAGRTGCARSARRSRRARGAAGTGRAGWRSAVVIVTTSGEERRTRAHGADACQYAAALHPLLQHTSPIALHL